MPGPVCQAATWSRSQLGALGRLLCSEARTKSSHVLLAPTICCARNPLGGRNFECFGEDPFLAGALAVEYVRGVQHTGEVAATPKHFVANEQEYQRFTIDADISEKALREIYLRPFEMVVRSPTPPGCIMTSYNSVNGSQADMSRWLISQVLREEWGFRGLVMSDWGGTNSTVESLLAGLDLEMPGPPEKRGRALVEAVETATRRGDTAGYTKLQTAIDTSVTRVLSLAQKHGLLGLTPEDASRTRDSPEQSSTTPQDVALMRSIAAAGIVLLKNTTSTLPLRAADLHDKQVAFIGPNALDGTPGGGGSATMNPQYLSQPMASFQRVAAENGASVKVKHALGALACKWLPVFDASQWHAPGDETSSLVRVDYFDTQDLSGPLRETQHRNSSIVDVSDSAPLAFQVDPVPKYSFRVTSVLTPKTTGTHSFSLSSVGDAVLRIDGALVVDNRNWTGLGETFYAFGSAEAIGTIALQAGKTYAVTVEASVRREPRPAGGFSEESNHVFAAHPSVRIGYLEELPSPEALIDQAVALADESEAAVVVLGLTDEWESEGYDRQDMALPRGQDALVEALVRRVRRPDRLVFVNQSGSPVELPWIDTVGTFLQAWYGGQEAGNALADVLLGTVNPSGRLPVTWPRRYADLPFDSDRETWPGVDGKVHYKEETQVGYRWYSNHDATPQWWFGQGLSYAQFSSEMVSVEEDEAGGRWRATVSVRNTGDVAGAEIVQLYFWPEGRREDVTLVGFDKTDVLAPGEEVQVLVTVEQRDAARWGDDSSWRVREGTYVFGVGNGAGDADRSTMDVRVAAKTWPAGV